MKRRYILFSISLLLVSLLWIIPCNALVLIDGERDGRSGLTVEFTDKDDPGDEEPPADKKIYVKIKNHMRRYVGVKINKISGGANNEVPVNEKDKIIVPSAKTFSVNTLVTYLQCLASGYENCGVSPASRSYVLAMPDQLEPGDEVRFRFRVVGPGYSAGDDPGDLEGLLAKTYIATYVDMFVIPILSHLTGKSSAEFPQEAIINDLLGASGLYIDIMNSLKSNDWRGTIEPTVKWIKGSTLLKKLLGGNEKALGYLEKLDTVLIPAAIAELYNALIHLITSNRVEEYNVYITRPRIDEIKPNSGKPGDEVIINGVGFDPNKVENNHVYFCELNDSGSIVPTLEAEIIDVSDDESSIRVKVPDGFAPGPLMVCTQSSDSDGTPLAYCSNWDVNFNGNIPSAIAITSPSDGDTINDSIQIEVVVSNPPEPFPISQAGLFVDGISYDDEEVNDASFSFVLDTDSLSEGSHTLEVRIDLEGEILTAQVTVTVPPDEPPTQETHHEFQINDDMCGTNAVKTYDALWKDHNLPLKIDIPLPICGETQSPYTAFQIFVHFYEETSGGGLYLIFLPGINAYCVQGETVTLRIDDTTYFQDIGQRMTADYYTTDLGTFCVAEPRSMTQVFGVFVSSSQFYQNVDWFRIQVKAVESSCAP